MRFNVILFTSTVLLCGAALWFWNIFTKCGPDTNKTSSTWRASVDNGDKPGIGIELTRDKATLTGRMFLLDPERPKDFTAGSERPMQIHRFNDTEIYFAVDWEEDIHNEMILRLSSPLQLQNIRGVLQSTDKSGTPREYEFIRVK